MRHPAENGRVFCIIIFACKRMPTVLGWDRQLFFIREATMRNPVSDALNASDLGLESLIGRMKDATFVVEVATGRIQLWNSAASQLFGYSAVEVLGWPLAMLLSGSHELLVEALASPNPVELAATRQDGSAISVALTLSSLGNGLALAIVRDDTDRKCTEIARERALNVLSHELRTPLSTVMGFGSLVLDGLGGPITDQQRHYLQRLLVATDDLHALVDDLLDMGLLHAGRLTLHLRPFSFPAAVEETIEGLSPQAGAKQVTIINQVPAGLQAVQADGKRIAQVLRNLLSNAIKFSPPGGQIWVRGSCDEGGLLCEIEDNGPGIPQEEWHRIFQPFVRLAGNEIPGTGLGLNIAMGLVEAHQGRIGVRGAPGGGSIFWFRLPPA